jgi:ankyrin repeat protein
MSNKTAAKGGAARRLTLWNIIAINRPTRQQGIFQVADEQLDRQLVKAVREGDMAAAAAALKAGARTDSVDSMNRTALFHAAYRNDAELVKMLLNRGAKPDIADNDGETPLIAALEHKFFDVADLILAAGADIDLREGRQGQTPIHWAYNMDMREGTSARTLWLVGRGADVNAPNANSRSILDRAWDDELSAPFGLVIAQRIGDFWRGRDAKKEQERLAALDAEVGAAVYGGVSGTVTARPLKLKGPSP